METHGGMNGHEALILNRILDRQDEGLEQMGRIEGRLIEGDRRFIKLEERVSVLEAKKIGDGRPSLLISLGSFMREIATPREWAFYLLVAIMAIKGVIAPADVRHAVLSALGVKPSVSQGSSS